MKMKNIQDWSTKRLRYLTPILVVVTLLLSGAAIYTANVLAASGFYFTTSASTYKVGDQIAVTVRENSGSACVNTVKADFSYPANLLRYDSMSITGSKFEGQLPTTSGNGTISMEQYTTRKECPAGQGNPATSGVPGDQLIGTVTFTVLAAGTANLTFDSSSTAISAADNRTNVSPSRNPITLTLTQPTPPPSTPPATPAPAKKPPAPAPKPASRPVTTITPVGSTATVPVYENDVVAVEEPVDIQPATIQPDGVNKIEYYLNGKLVATVKSPPYKYRLDTSKLLNGTYAFVTKTYYTNGQTNSVSQTVNVDNPFSMTQVRLWLAKYGMLLILPLILLIALVIYILRRRNPSQNNPWDGAEPYAADIPTYPSSPAPHQPTPRAAESIVSPSPVTPPAPPAQPQVTVPTQPTPIPQTSSVPPDLVMPPASQQPNTAEQPRIIRPNAPPRL